jgi:predicted O-linked N-acetylglucosamine transferase (SPINDLY family)
VASFRQAVRLKPDDAAAHSNLGNALRELGHLEEAVASLREALRLRPDYAEAYHNLGIALQAQGKRDEAVSSFQEAVRFKPDYAEAHQKLGRAWLDLGRLPEAQASFQEAIYLKPLIAEAHVDLGNALVQQRNMAEALASYEQALHIRPDCVEALNNLGNLKRELGQFAEAEASLRQALRVKPDYADAHYNLGLVLWRRGRLDEALASYQQALHYKPDYASVHLDLGNAYKDQGRLDDALAAYRNALRLEPNAAHIHSNVIFTLNYHPRSDPRTIQEECARWNRGHAEPLGKFIRPHANRPDPERRLRIGYVSPDFHEHVDSFFTIPLFSNHDHRRYEIYAYADVARPDAFTERLRGCADVWRRTPGLTDEDLADLVRADQIDILVDLKMHSAHNRLLTFARKPAPVQVAWLAYPGTTGLSAMDYRLTDPHLDPPGLFDAFCAEESVRLPDTFWCYQPRGDEPPVNALPGVGNGVLTFGCLNNFCKVNDDCLALWAQVLHAVPHSRLLLHAPSGLARERVLAELRQKGVAAPRVEFAEKMPREEYLQLYHRMDVALDPLPCNGGATTLEGLWMGVPTLTLVGKTVVGRAGWSIVCNLGLREMAAETPEQYVALAARLAGDLPRLQELRGTLRRLLQQSPLMDGNRFARHVEQAYRQMWRRWCRQTTAAEGSKATAPQQPPAGQGTDTTMTPTQRALALAWQHYQAGRWEQAEQLGQQVVQADPDQADAWHLLGLIAGQTGRTDLAIDRLNNALRLQPDFAEAHNTLGNVFIVQRELPEAVASFRQAVRCNPGFALAHNNLGNALREAGQLAEAVVSLQQALRLQPDYAEAHNNLGLAFQAQGKLDEAVANYQQALCFKPDYVDARNNLNGALGEQQRLAEATPRSGPALCLDPTFAAERLGLGVTLLEQGRLEEAAARFEQAIRLDPNSAEAHCGLGVALLQLGRPAEAAASSTASSTGLLGADALLTVNLCHGCAYRLDAIGGYRFLRLADRLGIGEDLVSTGTGIPGAPAGTAIAVRDQFETVNEFHGFDVGLRGEVRRGPWLLRGSAQVAVGNNHEVLDINGATTAAVPGRAPATNEGGLLALESNIGHFSRDNTVVIPEFGLKVGYEVTAGLRVYAGYSLLYWGEVARAGSEVDPNVNPRLLPPATSPAGPLRPAARFEDSGFWAQGIDLGVELRY